MKNIDREILKFCKEPRRYGEILELHKELNCTESTIKKHISKLKRLKKLTQNELRQYISTDVVEIIVQELEQYNGIKSEILQELFTSEHHILKTHISVRLPECLQNYHFTEERKQQIVMKIFELFEVAIFGNMDIFERLTKPGDYSFSFKIGLWDTGWFDKDENKILDRGSFDLFKKYSKEIIKKKL